MEYLTFANFKQVIPGQILTRGREYVRRGQIRDLSFDDEDQFWEAQVEGSELYDVRVEQTAAGGLECSCTCPYDYGPYCKHVAAVLYAIEEMFPDQLIVKPRKKAAKRQTRHDKLRQQLEKTSREQLVTVLLELALDDRELLNQLLLRLDDGAAKPMDYRRVVKDALRAGRGEYGYLDYTGSNRAGRKLDDLLNQADRWLDKGEIEKARGVYEAVIEETIPVIPHADDSSGVLGDCIGTAIAGLTEVAKQPGQAGQETLLTYCLVTARRPEFRGWDWRWDLLYLAADLVDSPARRTVFTSALDELEADLRQAKDSYFSRNFELENVAALRLAVIERLDGSDAVLEFLRAHRHLDRIRMILIERRIADRDPDEAMRLIQEGIEASQQHRLPGLTNQYQALRVKLLQQVGDKAALIEAARALWLDRADEDIFSVLKNTVPASEWPGVVEEFIKRLSGNAERLAWLYTAENRWNDLLKLIQSHRQASWLMEAYRAPLESRFPDEVATLYEKFIDAILAQATGRSQYQQVVGYLQRMLEMDKVEQAEAIVTRLKQQYPKRPALLDELKRL